MTPRCFVCGDELQTTETEYRCRTCGLNILRDQFTITEPDGTGCTCCACNRGDDFHVMQVPQPGCPVHGTVGGPA